MENEELNIDSIQKQQSGGMKPIIIIVLVVLILAIVGVGGVFYIYETNPELIETEFVEMSEKERISYMYEPGPDAEKIWNEVYREKWFENEQGGVITAENDDPLDYNITHTHIWLEDEAMQSEHKDTICAGTSVLYHKEKEANGLNILINVQLVEDMFGITDFSNIIGVTSSTPASGMSGVFINYLIEADNSDSAIKLANDIKAYINPKQWTWRGDYEHYSTFDKNKISIITNRNYIFITYIEEKFSETKDFPSNESLIDAFNYVIDEKAKEN